MRIRLLLPAALAFTVLALSVPAAHSQSVLDRMKAKAKEKMAQKQEPPSCAADAAPAATANTAPADSANTPSPEPAAPAASSAPASLVSYQNYDFTPGDNIIFADDFTATQDGEFPSQWELTAGQAVVNKVTGYPALLLTDGNYAKVSPRMKSKAYLPAQFTLEYDVYGNPGVYPLQVHIFGVAEDEGDAATLHAGRGDAAYEGDHVSLSANMPSALQEENFDNKWHHVAIAYRKPQFKIYVDQFRVLTVPDGKLTPSRLEFEGIGDQEKPITFRNVRIAAGGGMNLVGKKFTDAKIVTHGINFDVDRATLRPESMGTLNQIKAIMSADPSLKFEIDGHTDNSGASPHNLTLSQQRAEAVKAQLVSMGIDGSRLTTRGFGDTKPMASNDSPEGKANNRRVEFVRTSS